MNTDATIAERSDFIRDVVADDLRSGRHETIVTRFPPEPNGHLHIGHAKSICLNFGIAAEFGGRCHLRFDDTNPTKEEQEYVDAIEADVRWLGFDWGEHLYHASDYFEQLYEWAVHLIRNGPAYVDDLSDEEIREYRGTLTEPGTDSPWRERSVAENLDLFERMRAGEFPDGSRVLRARIDMASPNLNLRDPVLYRILHATHPRTGDAWCIYPTYDFAHGQSDAIEGITHSICTLEFENHRPLYDWFLEHLPVPSRPHQYEFARLNLTWTVLSKRFLLRLVEDGRVRGWDDPRMPTIAGFRRRGFPAEGIREFATEVGISKRDAIVEIEQLEHVVRDVLNRRALRRFAVQRPLKVVIEDYPEGQVEELEAVNNPEDPGRARGVSSSPGSSGSSATISWKTRRGSSSAWRQVARCASGTPTSSPAARSSRTPRVRWWNCVARTIPPREEGMPLTVAAPRQRFTGSQPRMLCPLSSASTSGSSCAPTPARTATCWRTSILPPRRSSPTAGWNRPRPTWPWVRRSSSSVSATSARIPIRPRGTSSSTAR